MESEDKSFRSKEVRKGLRFIKVEGTWYLAIDVGCTNFARARYGRRIVKERLFLDAWYRLEALLEGSQGLGDWERVREIIRG